MRKSDEVEIKKKIKIFPMMLKGCKRNKSRNQ